jgi:TonB-dependent SusC/RagA subfamily outer membrane receptor
MAKTNLLKDLMKKLILLLGLFVSYADPLFSQTIVITGTVTSTTEGEGTISGVTVQVKGTIIGTTTDIAGEYTLSIPAGSTTLVFTYIGMKRLEVEIEGRSIIDVVMESDVLGLDEVVITALGISREKKALGYSVTDIKGRTLSQSKESNIINLFQGKIAGVQITNNSGAVGASSQLLIRGIRSFGDNEALWVVDGTPISNMTNGANQWGGSDYGNAVADLDPENIESVSILKGANAAALYGSRARNGVVLVNTKKGTITKGIEASYSNTTMFNRINYLPTYQNEYGQGWDGSEFSWKLGTAPGKPDEGMSYQDWASKHSFKYVDGLGTGVNDAWTFCWGPRLDKGLIVDQFQGECAAMGIAS